MSRPTLEVLNPLVNAGETVEMEVTAPAAAPVRLVVREYYLENPSPLERELPLEWTAAAPGELAARVLYQPPGPGSHLALLQGPQGDLPSRYIGVTSPGRSVCYPFMNGAFFAAGPGAFFGRDAARYYRRVYDEVVHPLHLPFDYHVGGRFRPESADLFAPFARFEYLYGDTIIPMATTVNFGYEDRFSLWELSEDETVAALENVRALWAEWGFRPLETLNIHWCMGNVTMHAARRCGLKTLAGLVINYYMRDGESREIATGTPLRPYFMHAEDFRKAGPCDGVAPLCLPFSVVIPTNFHRGNVDAHWATDIQLVWDRSIESGTASFRSAEILDFLCDQPAAEVPFIFSMGMQNFGPPAVYDSNCSAVHHAAEMARSGRLVFANARALRAYYERHFADHPESLSYTRDFMVGSWLVDKPIHHPDVLQVENRHYHAAFNRGEALPDYFYDYDRPWDYPDEIFRDLTRFGPEPESVEGVTIACGLEPTDSGARLTVDIISPRAFSRLPVTCWDLPYAVDAATSSPPGLRCTPVTAPLEGSRHLLLEGPVEPGANRWVLDLAGRPHDYTPHLRSCHGLVGLKTIPNPGRTPYTYLWTELPGETPVSLRLPTERPTWAEYYDGHTVHASGGDLQVRLAWPRPWVRLWNLRADEVEVTNRLELAAAALAHAQRVLDRFPLPTDTTLPELLPAARAELASGLATDTATSLLSAATRAHQDRYIATQWPALVEQRQQWFADQVGDAAGDIVVAAHAYVKGHLGGPWRDLADLCDVIECAPGVDFSLPLYDYAIAWEPGHSAWHMGRAFTLRLCGLSAYAGRRVTLHLHGYDYDRLGRACSVRFVAKALAGGLPVEAQRAWIMPAGPEGRDHPDSLLSLEVPPEYLALEQFDVTLLEGYLARAVDMRKQVAYSVALSDVWVTVE